MNTTKLRQQHNLQVPSRTGFHLRTPFLGSPLVSSRTHFINVISMNIIMIIIIRIIIISTIITIIIIVISSL